MREDEKKDLIEKWQILGLSFMMMSKSQADSMTSSSRSSVTFGTVKVG